MKHLIILGAGTGGTILANRLRHRLPDEWTIAIVDPSPIHLYQPGLLFLPFGAHDEAALRKPRERTLHAGIEWIRREVTAIDRDRREVILAGGDRLAYDLLVVATGARLRFDLTPGIDEGRVLGDVHDFYTLEGAQALRRTLDRFDRGRIAVNVVEMPIKCPVAPLEFLFLADHYFRRRGIRDEIELVYATPLDAAFTRPIAAQRLGDLLLSKGIRVETEFSTAEVDPSRRVLRSYDDREIEYDLLVTIPTHSGAAFLDGTGLGNELAFVETDRATLQSNADDRIFALGDTTDLPSSKAGSVAHFQAEVLEKNILLAAQGLEPERGFDGHANCFVESGNGRALLIDFNYDVEPLPGRYPIPGIGPFSLLEETRMNHLGKLAFRWLYWKGLLPGRPIPVPTRMSMSGKRVPPAQLPPHV